MAFAGGSNPLFGRDAGPPPPQMHQPYGFPGFYAQPTPTNGNKPNQNRPAFNYPVAPHGFAYSPTASYVSPFGGRPAQPFPNIDSSMPANNMTNTTGGVGCEPGYNYFFPPQHTKIHVLRTGSTPPWRLPKNCRMDFYACLVPVSLSLAELMKGFGADIPIPKKNKITEVHQGDTGQLFSGISVNADNEKAMATQIKELGWDATRTGLPGEKPVVYLYVEKG